MRAIVQQEFGGPEVLVIEEAERPEPAEGQVRVRVVAAGVHAVDTNIRQGDAPPSMPAPTVPMTPGREIAGTVEAVGPGVDPAWIGTGVVAHVGFLSGGYAEFALAPFPALHIVPEGVTFGQAVAAIGTGRTAQYVLDAADLRQDDVVIVPGASGGLGSQLVHLVLAAGATVVALHGGEAKRAAVEGLSSDGERFFALDATDDAWPERLAGLLGGRAPTLLIDGVGGPTGRAAFDALGHAGRVVIIGWSSGEVVRIDADDVVARSMTVTVPLGRPIADLRALESRALAAVAEGRVTPLLDEYPLTDAAGAHAAIEQRRQRGKVVLVP